MVHATIVPVQKTLDEADFLPIGVEAVIANHPLDDMIIGKSLDSEQFQDFFDDHYNNSCPEQTRDYWDKLENDEELLKKIKSEIVNEWLAFITKTKPALLAISQYKSYFFEKNKIPAPDRHALDVLNKIREKCRNTSESEVLIGLVNDTSRWLVEQNPVD